MKDKLVKSGHFRNYYVFRRIAKVFFASVALMVVASVPVLVAYGVSVTQTMAEKAPEEDQTPQSSVAISSYQEAY